jgi:hypothetical protein
MAAESAIRARFVRFWFAIEIRRCRFSITYQVVEDRVCAGFDG